jgi:cobyrinic acid a,c-diamide synthase
MGKTTFVTGLILALKKRNLVVQPFKAGPDYIDPGFHTAASGRPCRNIDTMLIPRGRILELFTRSTEDADIAVVEGVMGLFDGAGGNDERGSTSHLSKLLKAPVVLLLDVRGMARSAGAMAYGYTLFDRRTNVAGFILNRVGSLRHFEMVREAVEKKTGLPVLGYLPKDERISLPERHLGLVPAWEGGSSPSFAGILSRHVEEHIDLDRLIEISRSAGELEEVKRSLFTGSSSETGRGKQKVRIAYALDDAFHFYYQDNLDILEYNGAELIPFSPIGDTSLPERIGGIYFGGGYPELYAEKLAGNRAMMSLIRDASKSGMPIYAECGGLMYLMERLVTLEGESCEMAGIFQGMVKMEKKLSALGYCRAELLEDSLWGKEGKKIRGHVFHWSSLTGVPNDQKYLFAVDKPGRGRIYDGLLKRNTLAGYLHLHFASEPSWAQYFVGACRLFAEGISGDVDAGRHLNGTDPLIQGQLT